MNGKASGCKRVLAMLSVTAVAVGCMSLPIPLANTQAAEPTNDFLFNDYENYSFAERAADLVSRMTLEEKAAQIGGNNPSIDRLGVSHYDYWKEGLHGIANLEEGTNQKATSFPYTIAMASSWDTDMIESIATAISDEARGYNNQGIRGLSYWSPTVNLARDPRWGRNHESYGEDVFLTSTLASSMVHGWQGDHEENNGYLKVFSTLKHYAANNSEYNRHNGTSDVDNVYLREYYTRTFKNIIQETGIRQVMSSYNRVNGTPVSANTYMLDTLLRKTFGFRGYVVSDCGAIANMVEDHQWKPDGENVITYEEAVKYGLSAGCDMNCGSVYSPYAVGAVRSGILSEDTIDRALVRIFTRRFETGEFDPAERVPWRSEEYSYANQIESQEHVQLAEDSSDESIVLLKNEKANEADAAPILPLDPEKSENVVVIGPLGIQNILGDYSGWPSQENLSTPVQGIEKLLGHKVTYITGSGISNDAFVCNTRNLKLIKGDKEVVLTPTQSTGHVDCQLENDANIGFIHASASYYYPQVDISGTTAFAIETSGGADTLQGTVELHLRGKDGYLLGKIDIEETGSWGNYRYFQTTGPLDLGGYTTGDLYVTFSPTGAQDMTFTDQETAAIQNADTVIACIGSQGGDSNEGHDRSTIAMLRNQDKMVKAVAKLNPRTVVYIQSVGVLEIGMFKDDVPAILWTCYNGQAQGNAMARVIFGKHNPTAKLPFTWYASNAQLPTINDYDLASKDYENGGWTYQYFTGDVDYPFGHGLSYTTFAYDNLTLSTDKAAPNDKITVSVDVTNTGAVDSKEVVQLYVSSPKADGVNRPFKQLKAFDKVAIAARETKTVTLTLDLEDCSFWDEEQQKFVYDKGAYTVMVGPSSDEKRGLTDTFTMAGTYKPYLSVLTATPDKVVLNAARPDKTLSIDLAATLSDDSFYDLSSTKVTYQSNHPDVARVDEDGKVHAVGAGLATITVSVTVDGVTKTDEFPVAVVNELKLDAILLDGKPLENFLSGTTTYYYPVAGSTAPTVSVPDMGGLVDVQITQATSVPGVAIVKLTLDSKSLTYTIHFRQQSTDYLVARFSDAEGRYTASKNSLRVEWQTVDGGQPVDLMTHRLEDLCLNITLILQNGQKDVQDSAVFKEGYIKLRSDTPNEGNRGWSITPLNLKSGINLVSIPLSRLSEVSDFGTIDWTQIGKFQMHIDKTSQYEGPFTMIVQDVMIVDTRYNNTRQHLQTLVNSVVNETDYTADSYAAYQTAKQAAEKVLNGDVATITYQMGDVDDQNGVTAYDALMALQAATKRITLTDAQALRANVDDTDGVTIVDALMILQCAAHKITLPLVQQGGDIDQQIAKAIEDIMAAKAQLERGVDKTSLQEAMERPIDADESVYTSDSLQRYKEALAAARTVLNNEKATQAEVDMALRNLNNARNRLKRPNVQPVLTTFSNFNKEYSASKNNFLDNYIMWADWTYADTHPLNLEGDRTGLYLIMEMTFKAPEGTDLSKCWEKTTIKLRSEELNGENNYGWEFRPDSEEVTEVAPGRFKIAIPLDKQKDNATGSMDWGTVERIITTTDINRTDGNYIELAGRSDLTMTISDTQIVDTQAKEPFDLTAWKAK